jgi:ATP-dependent Clp protease adaptor protein ClpS
MLAGMSDPPPRGDEGTGVVTDTRTRTERKLKKPRMYKVLLHNDDYTTMEFVVYILRNVFHRSETDAVRIMLHVHRNGIGVAGAYPREFAETRVAQTEGLARQHEFPLRCTLEEA